MILILLGPPGAGKGTQAKLLANELRIPHVSTGDMFRDHTSRGTELGLRVKSIMANGGLVPDEVTNEMVRDRVSRPDVKGGFILDGYPRTIPQAEFLEKLLADLGRKLDRVVSYEVNEGAIVERISGRRSCPSCGQAYHVTSNPPRREGMCDRDQTPLVLREDDRPEKVLHRMQEYAAKTAPLKAFYGARKSILEIDGMLAPDAVLGATLSGLGVKKG
ncbi:MAG: adenylate kinase [Anaeromyxobacter sp.]